MAPRRLLLAALLVVPAACGGTSNDAGKQPGSRSEVVPGVTSATRSRQGPPANVVGGFSIDVPAVEVKPGEELTPCFIFPLAVTGPSRLVGGAKLTVGKGMHHGNIVSRKKTGEGIRPCPKVDNPDLIGGEGFDILNGGSVLFASSTQVSGVEWRTFSDGDGFPVRDGYEIVARMHYLNTGAAPITVAPKYEWLTIDESKVVHRLSPFLWEYIRFKIPPKSEHTVTASCAIPPGMHIASAMPHMHARGVSFSAGFAGGALDGKRFLDSKGYDPEAGVVFQFEPALDLALAERVTFSCTWRNELDKQLTDGIGDNEMCILMGYAWPPEKTYAAVQSEGGACAYVAVPQ
jgi:hypothetical protein